MRLTTSPPSRAECHEIWEPKPPETLWACYGTPLPLPNIGLCFRICLKKYAEMCKTPIMTARLGLGSLGVTSTGAVHLTMKFGSCVLFL